MILDDVKYSRNRSKQIEDLANFLYFTLQNVHLKPLEDFMQLFKKIATSFEDGADAAGGEGKETEFEKMSDKTLMRYSTVCLGHFSDLPCGKLIKEHTRRYWLAENANALGFDP